MKGNDQDSFEEIVPVRSIKWWVVSLTASIVFLCTNIPLSAQSSISTASFIKKNIQAFQKKINSTPGSTSFETSWIKEMQLRTETKEFDFEQQSYTLRISPNSKKIRKAEVQLIRQLQEAASLDQYAYSAVSVSYTHLTLPTICSV